MQSKEEQIGDIILKFNQIEFYLKQILIKYLNPDKSKERFYHQILLNNSIISFNSKLKLFRHINNEKEFLKGKAAREFFDNIHYMANIRNSLVHTENALEFEKDDKGQIKEIHNIIDFFKPNGDFDIIRLKDALKKFNKKYDSVNKTLIEIHKKIK